jgi:hypothetical protein
MVITGGIDGNSPLAYKNLTDDGLIYSLPDRNFIEDCKLLQSLCNREMIPLDICDMIEHGLVSQHDYENLQGMGVLCEEAIECWEKKEKTIKGDDLGLITEPDLDGIITKELITKIRELINANR